MVGTVTYIPERGDLEQIKFQNKNLIIIINLILKDKN
jgi:hypothetical protein